VYDLEIVYRLRLQNLVDALLRRPEFKSVKDINKVSSSLSYVLLIDKKRIKQR
jgi:hypothetical protein